MTTQIPHTDPLVEVMCNHVSKFKVKPPHPEGAVGTGIPSKRKELQEVRYKANYLQDG